FPVQFRVLPRKKPLPRSYHRSSRLIALRPRCPCPRDRSFLRSSFPRKSVPFPLPADCSAYCFLNASTIISFKYSFSFFNSSIFSFILFTRFCMMSLTCLPVYILDIVRPPPHKLSLVNLLAVSLLRLPLRLVTGISSGSTPS